MSLGNKRSFQSSRMYYKQKDHKAIYMNDFYHHNIVITDKNAAYNFLDDNEDKLAWHKSFDDEYIITSSGNLILYPKIDVVHNLDYIRRDYSYPLLHPTTPSIQCGQHAYSLAAYDDYAYNNMYLCKDSEDGRVRKVIARNYSDVPYYLIVQGHANGFLASTDMTVREVTWYFQNVNSDGSIGSCVPIYTKPVSEDRLNYLNSGIYNDCIYILHHSGRTILLEEIPITSLGTRNTYSFTLDPDSIGYIPDYLYFNSDTGYTVFPHYKDTSSQIPDMAVFLDNHLVRQGVVIFPYASDFYDWPSGGLNMRLIKVNGIYYFYCIRKPENSDVKLIYIYTGSDVSSLSLAHIYADFTMKNIMTGETITLVPRNSFSNYPIKIGSYINRKYVKDKYYCIPSAFHDIYFSNPELTVNGNCFCVGGLGIFQTPEQIFDKYLDTQGGN